MNRFLLVLTLAASSHAQDVQSVVMQGAQVFSRSCATGYCHGARGGPGGAPRLAARGFDQAYIGATVARGIPGTAMTAFATTLQPSDLTAVVAYVATLNGIANPSIAPSGPGAVAPGPSQPPLTGDAARGKELFYDAVRGFARCSTCHEVGGVGMPVATPIAKVPGDVQALKALATPGVGTVTLSGDAMPALVLSKGTRSVVFYDLTLPPPVLHTEEPSAVKVADGSGWKHSSVIGAYSDAELASLLAYLRVVVKQ